MVDSNKDITSIRNITSTGLTTTNLTLGTTAVTASADELNKLTGTTAVTSDFNKLASITTSAAELNKLTGTTAVTSDFNKLASVTASADELNKLNGTTVVTSDFNKLASVTASAAELNKLTGTTAVTSDFNKIASVTASADELNTLTGISIGTASANKALIVDTNKDLNGIRNLSITGDLNIAGTTTTINSTQVNIKDNILQLNSGPSGIYDSGLIIQRYQTNNDNNIGDIINDSVKENYIASSVTINTIVLPSGANSNNNYYNSWWIKINSASTGTNQTRQVLSYNGSNKTLTLTNNFTTLPTGTISVNLYNKTFSNFIWQENNKRFITSYTAQDISGTLTILDYADLSTNNLSILSTTDSQSSSIGGSLTVSGGASIAKKLYIGTDLLIGGNIILNNTLITASATELNKLAGTTAVTSDFNKLATITATAADINKLATVTATGTELNYNDITTIGTAEASKALILDVNKDIISIRNITATGLTITNLTLGSTVITTTGAEINKLAGTTAITADFNKLASVTATASQLNYLSGTTLGTITASKALTVDSSSNINSILQLKKTASGQQIYFENGTSTGTIYHTLNSSLNIGTISSNDLVLQTNNINRLTITSTGLTNIQGGLQISGITVSASANELNYVDITTIGTAEANKALVLNTDRDITNIRRISTANIALNNSTNYYTPIDCGTTVSDKIIGLYNDSTTFYGFGANGSQLRLQTGGGNGFGFYTGSTNAVLGTQQMSITATSTSILQTTASTTSANGALIVSGGIGCAGDIRLGAGKRVWLNSDYGFSQTYSTGGTAEIYSYSNGIDNNYFGTFTNNDFHITTNSTVRMTFSKSGNVGIGIASPSYKLDVGGTINSSTVIRSSNYIYVSDSGNYGRYIGNWTGSGYWGIGAHSSNSIRLGTCDSTGNWTGYANTYMGAVYASNTIYLTVGTYAYYTDGQNIGGTNAAQTTNYAGYFNGRIACNGELNVVSDFRMKNNIEQLDNNYCKNFINNTTPVKFNYNNDQSQKHFGYIAQDVYKAGFTDLVALCQQEGLDEIIEEDGFVNPKDIAFVMSTNEIIPILAKNIKIIYAENEEQKNKITSLENENQQLKDQIQNILLRLQNLENN